MSEIVCIAPFNGRYDPKKLESLNDFRVERVGSTLVVYSEGYMPVTISIFLKETSPNV